MNYLDSTNMNITSVLNIIIYILPAMIILLPIPSYIQTIKAYVYEDVKYVKDAFSQREVSSILSFLLLLTFSFLMNKLGVITLHIFTMTSRIFGYLLSAITSSLLMTALGYIYCLKARKEIKQLKQLHRIYNIFIECSFVALILIVLISLLSNILTL